MENDSEDKKKRRSKLIEEYKSKKEAEMNEHPERFVPQWPYELFGIECGKGWEKLYKPIIDYICEYNKGKSEDDRIKIHQIKEKFGGLRFYTNFLTEELRKMIDDAEGASYNTCETCGKHIDKPIVENHWIYAECEDCHNKWKIGREKRLSEFMEKIKPIKTSHDNENGNG